MADTDTIEQPQTSIGAVFDHESRDHLERRIVARHGGRVWAESQVGEGSAFYFTLPGEIEV